VPDAADPMGKRCPFAFLDYSAIKETRVLRPSGEVLEDIVRLSPIVSALLFRVLYRGFGENNQDVIWCNACTARHEQQDNGDDAGSGDEDVEKYAEEDERREENDGKLLSTPTQDMCSATTGLRDDDAEKYAEEIECDGHNLADQGVRSVEN